MPAEGMLFVGDDGKILAGFTGERAASHPEEEDGDVQGAAARPCRAPPRSWTSGSGPATAEAPSDASFTAVAPFAESILLGNIALRVPKKLHWNADEGRFRDAPEADALITREYRKGWEL